MAHILHIDGDSFFASVEISLNPALKGRPVVTGEERGIATAMSREAKALGVHRGMPVFKIRKLYPEVVIVKSDYHHYQIFAQRMYNIVRRYSGVVEEYSIDECFARLDYEPGQASPIETARKIKYDLQKELGLTFSLGIAPTKVLAKVASKWNKPDGFTVINKEDIHDFLKDLTVGKVWGIGPATSAALQKFGIKTALDLTERPLDWIKANLDKRELELWHELRGEQVYSMIPSSQSYDVAMQASIQQTRTFRQTTDKEFIFSELSKNVEGACHKARAQKMMARRIYYFLKTQEFRYHRAEIILPQALQTPNEVLKIIKTTFGTTYKPGTPYRASGVNLAGLVPEEMAQNDLFGENVKNDKSKEIFKTIDKLDRRYGSHTIILGSSLKALGKRDVRPGADLRRFQIPFMGEVV